MPSINAKTRELSLRDSAAGISQFSYIRAVSCFAIVLLHCINTARVYYEPTLGASTYVAVWTICSMLMWAVPCFLMVTGALLLDPSKEIPLSKLLGKYIRHMAVALLVFTFIFTLIKYLSGDLQGSTGFADFFITNLIRDQAMPHLWYLYLMIVLYILLPLFKLMTRTMSDNMLWIAVAALAAIPHLCSLLGIENFVDLIAPSSIIYPAYLFIGYLLFKRNVRPHFVIPILLVSSLTLAILSYREASYLYDPSVIMSYSSPLVVLQSASIFSLMIRIDSPAPKWLLNFDRCTFGIYLIHMIFIRLSMKELGFDPFATGLLTFVPMAIIYFLVSYGLTLIIKRFTGNAIV